MASLRKRGGVYYAQYTHPETHKQKRKSLRTTILGIAKRRLVELEEGIAAGVSEVGPSRTPLPELLSAYVLHAQAHKTASTVSAETAYLRDLFGPICPELHPGKAGAQKTAVAPRDKAPRLEAKYLEDITTAQIADALTARVRLRGSSPKTHNNGLSIIRRLFNWAMEERDVRLYRDRNPASKVRRLQEQQHSIEFLSKEEIAEQLELLQPYPQLQAMVATNIFAGLRREELLWLTEKDIDLNEGQQGIIQIRAKRIGNESWTPKTKRNRVVPISTQLRSYLASYLRRPSQGGWFFPSPEGCRWNPDNFSNDLREVNKNLGLRWTCLHYRHTFGSHLAMKDVSLFKIATLMGNSPEICRRHYAALTRESLYTSVEFFDQEPQRARPQAVNGNIIAFRRGA